MPQTFGNWTVGDRIGRGGQGHVFFAWRTSDGPQSPKYALKKLSNTQSSQARERFAREIDSLKTITHPGIVKPVEHSEPTDPQPYYVMQYEEGVQKLADLISLPTSPYRHNVLRSLEFIAQCADGVAEANKQVIHRDLKPDNILVRSDGTPLIIDFGCCLPLDEHGVITLTDEGVGARNFLAPECEAGTEGNIDARSDVYSLGKVLWCMVFAERPFARERPAFSNKIPTKLMSENPVAGFLVDALLKSVRAAPEHRVKDCARFAALCRDLAVRVKTANGHPAYIAKRCLGCGSDRIQMSQRSIDSPMRLDAFVFLGNANNNPNLYAKFCQDCGSVTLHDTRPTESYEKRVDEASKSG